MNKTIIILIVVAAVLLLALALLLVLGPQLTAPTPTTAAATTTTAMPTTETTVPPTTLPPETEPPVTEPPFEPQMNAGSDPANWNTTWEIMANGELVENYQRQEPITFTDGDYFALPGVSTFRGSNYRTDGSYGTAEVVDGSLTSIWKMSVGWLSEAEWIGCGWTGQPLVVQWDEETKQHMNLYEDKKAKEGLTEVIYAKMDGRVHFFDIEDGTPTRDPLYVGMVFKGSGSIDPRGYPILYVGSGLVQGGKYQTMFVISLLDGSILYQQSGADNFAKRGWYAFDSSPLIHAETDTLIWPGESGVIYTMKLNTQYDKEAGTLSVAPDNIVKTRYTDAYHKNGRYLGYEGSAVAVENYMYIGDNAGMLHCIDLNTMQLVWAQDIHDDINSTPVFEWGEDGRGYIYIAPSLDYTGSRKDLPIYKIDAQTGDIVWSHYMTCVTPDGVSGGTLSSPVLGRPGTDLEGMIIYSVGRSPSAWAGQVVALNKDTGEVIWQFETDNYMWSSPVGIYTEAGKGYIFQGDASGNCYLIDGSTGEKVGHIALKSTIEASPVAFGDRVVMGTRSSIVLLDIN